MRKRARHREKMARRTMVATDGSDDSSCDSNRPTVSNADSVNIITGLKKQFAKNVIT